MHPMPQRLLASVVFVASNLVLPGTALAEQTLQTPQGQLRGVIRQGVVEYRGIPYAVSPAGERRWLPPLPPR